MMSNFSASASANKKVKAHNTRSMESEKAMVVVLSTAVSEKRRVRDVKLDVLASPGYPLPGSLSDVVRAATPVARGCHITCRNSRATRLRASPPDKLNTF